MELATKELSQPRVALSTVDTLLCAVAAAHAAHEYWQSTNLTTFAKASHTVNMHGWWLPRLCGNRMWAPIWRHAAAFLSTHVHSCRVGQP